jgi:precorrin-2 dehydrogenase/sirohydrochlorin ferrochelatase
MSYYPINLDITGKICLVIGGGKVAYRKVRSLLGGNGQVTVISPEAVPEIRLLAKRNELTYLERVYQPGDLEGAVLAFAATNCRQTQEQVALEAGQRGVLLNSADSPENCNFQVPAKVRRGELLITISTGGGSPAISRMVRMELEEQFGPEYGVLIFLFSLIREQVVPGPTSSDENRNMFRELLLSNILNEVRNSRWQRVQAILDRLLPESVDNEEVVRRVIEFAEDDPESMT